METQIHLGFYLPVKTHKYSRVMHQLHENNQQLLPETETIHRVTNITTQCTEYKHKQTIP